MAQASSIIAVLKASISGPVPKRQAMNWFLTSPHRRTPSVHAPTSRAALRIGRLRARPRSAASRPAGADPAADCTSGGGMGSTGALRAPGQVPVQGAREALLEAREARVAELGPRARQIGLAGAH